MKASVIIPVHNCGPWVAEALRSVAAQTCPPHEIIVVDDDSTDDSVAKVEATGLADQILHVDCHNAAAARNRGVEAATGDWVAFLDADDVWYENHLAVARDCLADKQCQLCVSDYERRRGDDEALEVLTSPSQPSAKNGLNCAEGYEFAMTHQGGLPTASMVVRRDAYLRVGGIDETQRRRHDIDLFLRLVETIPWAYSKQATWRYWMQRPDSISSAHAACAYYWLRALLRAADRMPHLIPPQRIATQANVVAAYALDESNPQLQREMFAMAGPWLSPIRRLFYAIARRAPRTSHALLHFARRLKRPTAPFPKPYSQVGDAR